MRKADLRSDLNKEGSLQMGGIPSLPWRTRKIRFGGWERDRHSETFLSLGLQYFV